MKGTKMTTKANENIIKTVLPDSGIKVEADISRANGHCLMKAREASGGIATVVYIMAEIATFDGKQFPAPEILNLSAFDVIELETLWASRSKK